MSTGQEASATVINNNSTSSSSSSSNSSDGRSVQPVLWNAFQLLFAPV